MKIWVAGHKGMVGSSLTTILKKQYKTVHTNSRKELDLTDLNAVRNFLSTTKLDWIFIAAGKVGGIKANINFPLDFLYENLMINNNILRASYEMKIKKVENPRFEDSTWVSSSRESAAKAIRFLQKTDNWNRPEVKQRLNLLRAAPSSSYEIVLKTRGIGPNPQQSSFDSLKESLKNHFDVNVVDDFQNLDRVQDHLIVVFENYTLPGIDFGNNKDEEVIKINATIFGEIS